MLFMGYPETVTPLTPSRVLRFLQRSLQYFPTCISPHYRFPCDISPLCISWGQVPQEIGSAASDVVETQTSLRMTWQTCSRHLPPRPVPKASESTSLSITVERGRKAFCACWLTSPTSETHIFDLQNFYKPNFLSDKYFPSVPLKS